MKRLELSEDERRTPREMGIFHPHPRTRMRAQGILRLSQGPTLQQTAEEFMVYLNSVEQWRQRWNKLGLAGLYEGRHTGRPKKWTPQQRQALGELAQSEGGTVVALLRSDCPRTTPIGPARRRSGRSKRHTARSRFPGMATCHTDRCRACGPVRSGGSTLYQPKTNVDDAFIERLAFNSRNE
jgi:hypothetical protein